MELGVTVGNSIERIERTGSEFNFVEFGLSEASGVPEEMDDRQLLDTCERADVEIDVHLPFKQVVATSVPELNEGIAAHQERLLSWAGDIGARKAVLHGTVRNPSDTSLRPTFAEQLSSIVETGERFGVEVVVENVGHQGKGLPLSVLGDLATEAGAPVCFDVGHAYMEGGNDAIERFLQDYGQLISHLHVHDARTRGDTHLPAGAGEITYPILGEHLAGFDGTVAIEVFCDDSALLEDTRDRITAILSK